MSRDGRVEHRAYRLVGPQPLENVLTLVHGYQIATDHTDYSQIRLNETPRDSTAYTRVHFIGVNLTKISINERGVYAFNRPIAPLLCLLINTVSSVASRTRGAGLGAESARH